MIELMNIEFDNGWMTEWMEAWIDGGMGGWVGGIGGGANRWISGECQF